MRLAAFEKGSVTALVKDKNGEPVFHQTMVLARHPDATNLPVRWAAFDDLFQQSGVITGIDVAVVNVTRDRPGGGKHGAFDGFPCLLRRAGFC